MNPDFLAWNCDCLKTKKRFFNITREMWWGMKILWKAAAQWKQFGFIWIFFTSYLTAPKINMGCICSDVTAVCLSAMFMILYATVQSSYTYKRHQVSKNPPYLKWLNHLTKHLGFWRKLLKLMFSKWFSKLIFKMTF